MKTAALIVMLALIGYAHAESANVVFKNGLDVAISNIKVSDGTRTLTFAGPLAAGKSTPSSNGLGTVSWTQATAGITWTVSARGSDGVVRSFNRK